MVLAAAEMWPLCCWPSLAIGVLLALLILRCAIWCVLQDEVSPILRTTQDTASRVGGTVNLMSDTVVTPLIKANSYAAGVRQAIGTLKGFRKDVHRRTPRTQGGPRPPDSV